VPVMVSDLGTVSFGPDIRRGAADWNGKGETVGGIVVMRFGQNALNVINGVKKKIADIQSSLPPGVEIVSAYDRSDLIHKSIGTLQRDLLEEAIIVSLVIVIFLFHFRSALIPILTLPIAVIASFIPMYYFHVSANIMSLGGLALAIGVLVDAAIVMVENGYRVLSDRQQELEASASRQDPPLGQQSPAASVKWVNPRGLLPLHPSSAAANVANCFSALPSRWGAPILLSLVIIVVSFLPVFPAGSAGGPHVPPAGMDQDACHQLLIGPFDHPDSHTDAHLYSWKAEARIGESGLAHYTISLSARAAILPAAPLVDCAGKPGFPGCDAAACHADREPVYAAFL